MPKAQPKDPKPRPINQLPGVVAPGSLAMVSPREQRSPIKPFNAVSSTTPANNEVSRPTAWARTNSSRPSSSSPRVTTTASMIFIIIMTMAIKTTISVANTLAVVYGDLAENAPNKEIIAGVLSVLTISFSAI